MIVGIYHSRTKQSRSECVYLAVLFFRTKTLSTLLLHNLIRFNPAHRRKLNHVPYDCTH